MRSPVYSVLGLVFVLTACTGTQAPSPSATLAVSQQPEEVLPEPTLSNGETAGAEAFSAAEYGVAASPLVAVGKRLKRGGGYEKVGRPYKIKGRTYVPTHTPKKVQTGRASWYGKAFHGRLTANGEIFDMNHLTAAHKTMPLPSYARVTNKKNGRSVIVRVNDRGPFSRNRVIDLSKRAAEVLDFIRSGTAEVRVEYIGPAPLHGQDDDYLLASARGLGSQTRLTALPPDSARLPGVRAASDIPVQTQSAPLPQPGSRPAADLIGTPISSYVDDRIAGAFGFNVPATHWKSH